MSKYIKIPSKTLAEIKAAFDEALKSINPSDGRINFTKTFDSVKEKATLYFTEIAYLKMIALVRDFNSEIAWHGIAKRCEDEENAYIISDILVYPQEVTGATVTTDQQKYQMWLMNHDDEVFNNIRMQGHSHVNMGVTPSAVDTTLYEKIREQLDETMFYIFLIWNKKGDKTIKIYDNAKNILFETADVTVKIREDGTGMEKFLREAKEMVQEKKHTTPKVVAGTGSYYKDYYGDSYKGYYSSYAAGQAGYSKTSTTKSETTVSSKTETKQDTAVKEKKPSAIKPSGKKKKKKKAKGDIPSDAKTWGSEYYSLFDKE